MRRGSAGRRSASPGVRKEDDDNARNGRRANFVFECAYEKVLRYVINEDDEETIYRFVGFRTL